MARPIDEKIVAMKMDNSDLKRKAAETTTIFGRLRDGLNKIPGVNLDKVTRSFGNIQQAANRVTLNTLSSAADQVTQRFSTLDVVATTALVNIANRATNAGVALWKSLTTEQLMDGFREYEMKMGSIGTMLANTEWAGSDLDDVKKTLGELNDYADNTIYNFAEMTSSIGRFTAAGVTLEDSAIAIKGLGNLAAISGSNTEQLNVAMYQMSQALAAGKLNLMDWNSMVNAGMGGKKTQDALVATAKAMGKTVDMSNGFRDSIQDGWLTSEVFLETLKKFGKDKSMTDAATKVRTFTQMLATLKEGIGSGWAESWEIIFGDFEEATKLWTGFSNVVSAPFDKATKARNDLLRGIFEGGGVSNIFGGIANAAKPVVQVFGAIGDGFKLAFPPAGVDRIVQITKWFKEFTSGMKLSSRTVENLTTVSHGLFSIFSTVWEIVKNLTQAVFGLLPSFKEIGAGVVALLASLAQFSIALNESVKSGDFFKNVMNAVNIVLGVIGVGLYYAGDALGWLGEKLKPVGTLIASAFGGNEIEETGTQVESLKDKMEPIGEFFEGLFNSIVNGFNWVKDKLVDFGQTISDAMPSGNTLFAGGFIAGLIAVVGIAIKMAWDLWEVFTGWGKIGNGVTDVLESVGGALNAFTTSVYANSLLTIAIAMGVLAVSFKLMEGLDGKDIAEGLYAIIGSMSALIGAMAIMAKYDLVGGGMKTAVTMVGLAIAFSIMAGAIKKFSNLKWSEITKGIVGLVGVMGALSGAMVLMSKFGGAKVGASALQMIAIAASIHILISAVKKIADINTGDLVKGTSVLAVVLLQMALFLKIAGGAKFGIGSTLGMLAIGQAIGNITKSINEIAKIDTGKLVTGLVTITLILAQVALFAKLTSNMGLLTAGAGMLLVAASITALIVPIKALGNTDLKTLAVGLGAMAVALLAIGVASRLMTGMVAAGAGIALLAAGLTLLLIPIKGFASMSWGQLAIGMTGLAASLLIVGGASLLLAPATIPMLAFGAALALLGIGMLAAGAGMALFSTGLVSLAAMTAAAITTIVATLGTLIVGLTSLIPLAVDFVVKIFMQISKAITDNTPTLVNRGIDMVLAILDGLNSRMPDLITKGTELIVKFLDGVKEAYPQILTSATDMIVTYIEAMASNIETNGSRMVNATMELWGQVLLVMVDAGVQMINALWGWIPGVEAATTEIGSTAEEHIRDNFLAGDAGKDKGDEFAKALANKSGAANTAGAKVGKAGKTGADSISLTSIGSGAGQEFVTALGNKASSASTAGVSIANAGKNGAGSISMSGTGSDFGTGFANGINSEGVLSRVASAARSIASAAANTVRGWLDINSPSRVAFTDGGWFGEGFAQGIGSKAKAVGVKAKNLAVTAKDSLNRFIDGFELPEEDNELQFKAVINYDQLDTSKFGSAGSLNIAPNTSLTNSLIPAVASKVSGSVNTIQNNDNSSISRQQEEQIGILKQQLGLLSNISNKDNSVYLDGKEIYNNNKNIQNNQTIVRNLFKGVITT